MWGFRAIVESIVPSPNQLQSIGVHIHRYQHPVSGIPPLQSFRYSCTGLVTNTTFPFPFSRDARRLPPFPPRNYWFR